MSLEVVYSYPLNMMLIDGAYKLEMSNRGLPSITIVKRSQSLSNPLHMTLFIDSLNNPSKLPYDWSQLEDCLCTFPILPSLEVRYRGDYISWDDFRKAVDKMRPKMPRIVFTAPQIDGSQRCACISYDPFTPELT